MFNISQAAIDETREVCERDSKERKEKIEREKFEAFAKALYELDMMITLMGLTALKERVDFIKAYLSEFKED